MAKSYLDKNQRKFLGYFSGEKKLNQKFYFTGGTALSEYYLHHRRSIDLDFFCEEDFVPQSITPYIKKAKTYLDFKEFDFQQAFNRNIFQLIFAENSFLKVEFTYFPFTPIDKQPVLKHIKIDSLLDIAVNKVFTISQQARGRDFFDLYYIVKKTKWSFEDLLFKARLKFDWHIDRIQLGTNMMQVKKMKDDPLIGKYHDLDKVEKFILDQAKKIGEKAFKKIS